MTIDGSIAILLVLGIVSVALLIEILFGLDKELKQASEILEEIRQRDRRRLENNLRTPEEIIEDTFNCVKGIRAEEDSKSLI